MKKTVFAILIIFMTTMVSAQTNWGEMRQSARRLIYAAKPVEAVRSVEVMTDLFDLIIFATESRQSSRSSDPNALNETDSLLMEYLGYTEYQRRVLQKDDFSLYLQEVHEKISPLMRRNDSLAKTFITIDSWLDLFKLNLMFD